jgi:hypothetical protein
MITASVPWSSAHVWPTIGSGFSTGDLLGQKVPPSHVLDAQVAMDRIARATWGRRVSKMGEGRAEGKVRGGAKSSTAIREAGAVKCPSIDMADIDDAVDYHLMAKIAHLWPRPANEEEEDPTEALRTDLRVAIKEVLAGHRVRLVES